MAVKKISEHEVQKYVCNYLRKKGFKFWAVPNGFVFNGSSQEISRYRHYMTQEGVTKGVFDLTILLGNGEVAFLEIKTIHGSPRKEQKEWLEYFKQNGYRAEICVGIGECIAFIDKLEIEVTK